MTDLHRLQAARRAGASGSARRIRQAAGLSQAEVAAVLGVAQTTVASWETGRRVPRGPAAVRYGRLLEELARDSAAVAL